MALKDKVNELLSKTKQNLPEMAFLFYSIRLVACGASFGDALVLVGFTAFLGYSKFLYKKEVDETSKFQKDLTDLQNQMHSLKMQLNGGRVVGKAPNGQEVKDIRRF